MFSATVKIWMSFHTLVNFIWLKFAAQAGNVKRLSEIGKHLRHESTRHLGKMRRLTWCHFVEISFEWNQQRKKNLALISQSHCPSSWTAVEDDDGIGIGSGCSHVASSARNCSGSTTSAPTLKRKLNFGMFEWMRSRRVAQFLRSRIRCDKLTRSVWAGEMSTPIECTWFLFWLSGWIRFRSLMQSETTDSRKWDEKKNRKQFEWKIVGKIASNTLQKHRAGENVARPYCAHTHTKSRHRRCELAAVVVFALPTRNIRRNDYTIAAMTATTTCVCARVQCVLLRTPRVLASCK